MSSILGIKGILIGSPLVGILAMEESVPSFEYAVDLKPDHDNHIGMRTAMQGPVSLVDLDLLFRISFVM